MPSLGGLAGGWLTVKSPSAPQGTAAPNQPGTPTPAPAPTRRINSTRRKTPLTNLTVADAGYRATASGSPDGDTPTVGCMGPEGLEVSKISRQDEHAAAAGFVISNGNHNSVHGRGCAPAGRSNLVA